LVCAETAQHSQIISQVVQAGKHLFVEKPLAHNVADARAIRDQVSGSGLVFQTGFFLRYAPEIAQVQAQSPFLSHVLTHDGWTAGWFHGDHAWMADTTAAGTGGFGDLGIHCLDLLLHLKGHHFVNAEVRVERDPQRDLDLSGEALLGFADTSRATFRAGWQGTAVNALSDGERTVGLSAKPVDALLAFVDELAGRPRSLIPVEEACERTVSMLALLRDAT
jgi:predicted dehydrogenase